MQEIQQSVSRPPIIVFCDENNSAFAARVVELGAHDTITEPDTAIALIGRSGLCGGNEDLNRRELEAAKP